MSVNVELPTWMPNLPRHCRISQSIAQQKRAGASMQPCRTPEEVWNGKENPLGIPHLANLCSRNGLLKASWNRWVLRAQRLEYWTSRNRWRGRTEEDQRSLWPVYRSQRRCIKNGGVPAPSRAFHGAARSTESKAAVTSMYAAWSGPVLENTYFMFFSSDFQKTWLFTFFWNDVSKSRKKSLAKV